MTRLPALTAHRGLAALAVVAYHAGWWEGGWVGVPVFLAQSGYLTSSRGVRLARRAARILPLMWLVGVVALVLGLAGDLPLWAVLTAAVWPWGKPPLAVGVLWSLHLEGLWYLAASLTQSTWAWTAALCVSLALGPLAVVGYAHPAGQASAILLGALAARLKVDDELWLAVAAVCLPLGVALATAYGAWGWWLTTPIAGLGAAAVCVLVEHGRMAWAPASLVWLGERCLGVYLLHPLAMAADLGVWMLPSTLAAADVSRRYLEV